MIASGCYESLCSKHKDMSPPHDIYNKYKYDIPNYSVRMTVIQGCLVKEQLKYMDKRIQTFNNNYNLLKSLNSNENIDYIDQYDEVSPVYDSVQIRVKNLTDEELDRFLEKLKQYKIQKFNSEDNARYYKNWKFCNIDYELIDTDKNLKNVCDLRLSLDYTKDDIIKLNFDINTSYDKSK